MKKIILLIVLFLGAKSFAQTNGITYQAVILNPSGEQIPGVNNTNSPMVGKDICLQFQFIDEFSKIEYQETIKTKTDQFGMVNLVIGSGNQTAGYATSFESMEWNALKKSLIVGINTDGSCSSFIQISNQPFTAVPFAFSAINAGNVTGVVDIQNGGTNAVTIIGAKTNLSLEKVNNTSDLDKPMSIVAQTGWNINSNAISAEVSRATDAELTKEDAFNKSTDGTFESNSDIKFPTQKATKTYIDSQIARGIAMNISGIVGIANGGTNSSTIFGAKTNLGLEEVDNTTDLDKPISVATTTALGNKVDKVSGERLINAGEITKLEAQSGSNTGDQDLTGLTHTNRSDLDLVSGTNTGDQDLSALATTAATNTALGNKVDKVSGERLINAGEITKLDAQSGSNTGDQDLTGLTHTNRSDLDLVSGTNTGDQDLSALATTAATNTALGNKADKVSGERLINAGEITKLEAQSGSNTGDQDLTGLTHTNRSDLDLVSGTNTGDQDLSALATTAATNTALGNKVDKVSGERLINAGEITKLDAQSGSNTGDQDLTGLTHTNRSDLDLVSGTNTGDQDLSALATTAATNTALGNKVDKVSGERLINAGEITKLGAQSGSNTGDQDLTRLAPLASPTFIGTVTIPTLVAGANSYPTVYGNANQVLTTNGAGVLAWSTPSGTNSNTFVDLTTDQSIAGVKTFNSDVNINGLTIGRGNFNENSNTAIGVGALGSNAGYANTAIGRAALEKNVDGRANTALGYTALQNNTSGTDNVAIGTGTLLTNKIGVENIAIGLNADIAIDGISNAVAIGANSKVIASNTIQLGNTAITALKTSGTITAGAVTYPNTDGTANQVLQTNGAGVLAWSTPSGGDSSTFVDLTTNQNIAGTKNFSDNIRVKGIEIGQTKVNNQNTVVGYQSLVNNVSGGDNTSMGFVAMNVLTSGRYNTGVGSYALHDNAVGDGNTALGQQSLQQTTNSNNTGIGSYSLRTNTTGTNNTAIGSNADVVTNALTNATAIGNSAIVDASNKIQLGNTSVTSVNTSGTITAGKVTYPNTDGTVNQVLQTNGNGIASWTTIAGPRYASSTVLQEVLTSTTDSEIYLPGLGFRWNQTTKKLEIKGEANNNPQALIFYFSYHTDDSNTINFRPATTDSNSNSWTAVDDSWSNTLPLIEGYYSVYDFDFTVYPLNQGGPQYGKTYNVKILLDGYGAVHMRAAYY
jgi:hypothetical protein